MKTLFIMLSELKATCNLYNKRINISSRIIPIILKGEFRLLQQIAIVASVLTIRARTTKRKLVSSNSYHSTVLELAWSIFLFIYAIGTGISSFLYIARTIAPVTFELSKVSRFTVIANAMFRFGSGLQRAMLPPRPLGRDRQLEKR